MDILLSVRELLQNYEACLSRIRSCRAPVKDRQKEMDINRILFARGQEEAYDADELYALFRQLAPERLTALRQAIREEQWQLMDMTDREAFLLKYLPESELMDWYDLLTDFRSGGYRILGDLVCDIDDENTQQERKRLIRETDSEEFTAMMTAYIKFDAAWRNKVIQYQVPIFSEKTKGAWVLRFDDVIADALELGPLRNAESELPADLIEKVSAVTPRDVPLDVITTLILYYTANRQDGTEWVALPVTNFEAYFGTSFGRKYLPKLPKEVFERSDSGYGVSRFLVKPPYLPQI